MTAPAPGPQIDMGRVVQRAANNMAGSAADLAAQLAMTQEVSDISAARVVALEKQLEEKDAELARRDVALEAAHACIAELEKGDTLDD